MTVADKTKEALQKNSKGTVGNKKVTVPQTFEGLKSYEVRDVIEKYKSQIAQAVPSGVTPEKIIQICTTTINRNPELLSCTSTSLIGAVMQCSILGLDPTPLLGLCYFIPYRNKQNKNKKEVQFQLGYKGLINLVRRSGEVQTIFSYVVYKDDNFKYELGLNPDIKHLPAEGESKRADLKYVYAVIKYKDGGYNFVVMNRQEVYRVKAKSQAKNSDFSPWNGELEEEMWKKTAIKRLLKLAPIATEEQRKINIDEATITTNSFDLKNKEVDPDLVDFNYEEEPNNVDTATGEILDEEKEEPKANKEEPKKEITEEDFIKQCAGYRKLLKEKDEKEVLYKAIMNKYHTKTPEEALKSQYQGIINEFDVLINE